MFIDGRLLEVVRHIINFSVDIWVTFGLYRYINYNIQPTFEELGIIYCILLILSILYLKLV